MHQSEWRELLQVWSVSCLWHISWIVSIQWGWLQIWKQNFWTNTSINNGENALETVKEIKEISSTLQEKESDIKKESEKMYKIFMAESDHYHPPNTPCSPSKSTFSDCVSNEALKRVQSELMTQIDGKLIGFQNAEKERFSEMKKILQKIQDGLQKQA